MNIKKYLSGSLKIVLAGIVAISANTALANPDLTKSENYFPGAKYDLFNGGRFARQGSKIVDVNNHIQVSGSSFQAGSVLIQLQQYSGGIEFERSFENHPLSEHGSWSRSNSKQLPFFHGNISSESLGIGVSRGTIYGVEIHPEDAYDAKDGGDHPYDIYNYRISGSSITTSIHPLDLPTLLPTPPISPYNGNGDSGNGQPENNADGDSRNDNIRNEYANGQAENADNGSWNDAEVKSPINVTTAEAATAVGGLATDALGSIANKGRGVPNSEDSTLANALACRSVECAYHIGNAEEAGRITHAQANALRKVALNNKRILNNGDVKIGGYKKISLDVETGGSGKINIHLQVDGNSFPTLKRRLSP